MKIAIQGIEGSFHHEAALKLIKNKTLNLVCCSNFRDVFKQTTDKDIDYGVVAIENTNFGSINEVYDLLEKYNNKLSIIEELPLRVHQNLIAAEMMKLDEIQEIHSHPIAIEQCSEFIKKNMPNCAIKITEDTALSVKKLSKQKNKVAAIGSTMASKIYKKNILAKNIDNRANYTRFLLITKKQNHHKSNDNNKYSIVFNLVHQEGSLANLLNILSQNGCNLTKIQSRPYLNQPWKYKFYIDFIKSDSSLDIDNLLSSAIIEYKILGNYEARII